MTTETAFAAAQVPLEDVLGMREEYRRAMGAQIVRDSWHARGFTRLYVLRAGGGVVGYGAVGGSPGDPQDTLVEFFLRPASRGDALPLFRALVAASGARTVLAQTNDVLLSLMLYDCGRGVRAEAVLFAEGATTTLVPPDPAVAFARLSEADRAGAFPHGLEPVGDWGLTREGEVVATGGALRHYNPPFADLYMEVAPAWRRRGLGSYLIQELKRVCYEAGRVPAARCDRANVASRRTLERAGMFPCARMLRGRLAG